MLQDTLRFNRETSAASPALLPELTLGAYLERGAYSAEFRDWYLLPMAAAIWSCPTEAMLDYPLTTFVRFARNHGLLQITDRPQWLSVKSGGREYVQRIAASLPDVRLATPVRSLLRDGDGVWLGLPGGECERFDQVVLACHSDQILRLLGNTATAAERRVIGAIGYQPNRAVLHTDRRLLPRDERVWSAWNYLAGSGEPGRQPVSVSYLINRLQALPVQGPGGGDAQPAHRTRPATGDRRFRIRPSDLRPGGDRRPGPPGGDPGHGPAVVLRRLGRLWLPRGWPQFGARRRQPAGLPGALAS
jgi:predicted NAD/FAD-binding protein